MKNQLPGVLFCLAVALPAWYLGSMFPIVGGPVFGILLGMMITLAYPGRSMYGIFNYKVETGIKYTAKKLLQYSIILLGFEMNLWNVLRVGGQSLFVMLFTLSMAFIVAYFVGKALKMTNDMTTLIGVGTSICGGSAIAATAPVIQAKDEDVVQAISTIFLFNIVAVFIFPALGHLLGMSDVGFGMWAGTAINDTSSVVAAGAAWSATAGNNIALGLATIVKLTRTLMIVPITLVLAIYTAKKSRKNADNNFSFMKVFPWFVIGFILAAVANTFAGIPIEVAHQMVALGKFVIIMSMVGIGLNTDLKKLITSGHKPIILGLSCWVVVAVVSLIVQISMGMW